MGSDRGDAASDLGTAAEVGTAAKQARRPRRWWQARYIVLLLFLATVTSFLSGLVKALIGTGSTWQATLSDGLAGTVTAFITVLAYDIVKSRRDRRERAIGDLPAVNTALVAAEMLMEGWLINNGAAPDVKPEEVFDHPLEEQTRLTPASLLDQSVEYLSDLKEKTQKLQELRQATRTLISHDEVANEADVARYLKAVFSARSTPYAISEVFFPSQLHRRVRLNAGEALSKALATMRSVYDDEDLSAAITLFAMSLAEVQAIDQFATHIEHDMKWDPVARDRAEVITLGQSVDRLTAAVKKVPLTTYTPDEEVLRAELAAASLDFPQLLGLYVNLGRTVALWLMRLNAVLRALDRVRVSAGLTATVSQ